MKKSILFSFSFIITFGWLATGSAWADPPFPVPPKGGLTQCAADLTDCTENLGETTVELMQCESDLADCQAFPATGQTSCWDSNGVSIPCAGTGQDGDIQAGARMDYTDTGLTIIDNNTKLEWEKKDGVNWGVHDVDQIYTWSGAFGFIGVLTGTCNGEGVTACTADADCGAGGVCGFAGYTDWRLPNVKELLSIYELGKDYEEPDPAFPAVFNNGCVTGCALPSCSCMAAALYWSSTTVPHAPAYGYIVNKTGPGSAPKFGTEGRWWHARAVRGGLID